MLHVHACSRAQGSRTKYPVVLCACYKQTDPAWLEKVHVLHTFKSDSADCLLETYSGSKFLKSWMDFLEENADLRYPNLDDILHTGAE